MNKEKKFDCIQFKNELQVNLVKKSGAKNLKEFVNFANKEAKNSKLFKVTNNQKNTNGV